MNKKLLSVAIVASVASTSTIGVGYAQETVNNRNVGATNEYNESADTSTETGSNAAELNGTEYASLSDAISNANENDTIILLNNVEENITLEKNITIDGQHKYAIIGKTTLKSGILKNLTLTTNTNSLLSIGNSTNTNITMDGVTVKYPVSGTVVGTVSTVGGNNANITIKNCTFMNEANNGDTVVNASEWSYGLYMNEQGESGEFNFINSEFDGAFRTMLANINGTVNIKDNVFKNTIFSNNSGSTSGSGEEATCLTTANTKGNFDIENNTFDNAGAMYFQMTENANMVNNTIKFDKFEHYIQASEYAGHELDLTQNSFELGNSNLLSVDRATAPIILPVGQKAVNYWAWYEGYKKNNSEVYESYQYYFNEDGSTTFLPGTELALREFVTSSNGKNIDIDNGDTIKIESDINLSEKVSISDMENINIDLNGGTLKSESGSVLEISGGSINIVDGTLSTSDKTSEIINILNGASVRFRDIDFDLASESSVSPVKVSDGGATVTVAGTITSENLGDKKVISNDGNGNVTLNIEEGTTSSGSSVDADDIGNLIEKSENDTVTDVPSLGDGDDNSTSSGGGISTPTYTHTQIIGKDRYETASLLADKLGNYDTVILVNSDKTMADGLSAASLAGKLKAPILPVKQNKIPDSVMQRISKAKNVYIIGGTDAISKDVENKLSDKNITRISGKTRYETSQKIAELMGNYTEAYIVNGLTGEADAMSISSVAAKEGAPIIVTDGKKSDYVKKSGTEYTVIGGEKAVTEELASKYSTDRISGATRYETNRAVMNKFYSGADTVYLANGETLVDAMTASLIAKNSGVVLVSKNSDNSILKARNTVQVGGTPFTVNIPK